VIDLRKAVTVFNFDKRTTLLIRASVEISGLAVSSMIPNWSDRCRTTRSVSKRTTCGRLGHARIGIDSPTTGNQDLSELFRNPITVEVVAHDVLRPLEPSRRGHGVLKSNGSTDCDEDSNRSSATP
jgi:hypothetical protein